MRVSLEFTRRDCLVSGAAALFVAASMPCGATAGRDQLRLTIPLATGGRYRLHDVLRALAQQFGTPYDLDLTPDREYVLTPRQRRLLLLGNAGLLMDFLLESGATAGVGSEWTVRADDVTPLLNLGFGTEVTGEVLLRRGDDVTEQGIPLQQFTAEGEIVARGDLDGKVRLRDAQILFSPEQLVVREARWGVEGETRWHSQDHLLFGAEDLKNVEVEVHYKAERSQANP